MGAGESKEKKPTPSARTVHGHGNGHGPSRWASNIWRSLKKSPRLRKKSKESQKSKKSSSDVSFMTHFLPLKLNQPLNIGFYMNSYGFWSSYLLPWLHCVTLTYKYLHKLGLLNQIMVFSLIFIFRCWVFLTIEWEWNCFLL